MNRIITTTILTTLPLLLVFVAIAEQKTPTTNLTACADNQVLTIDETDGLKCVTFSSSSTNTATPKLSKQCSGSNKYIKSIDSNGNLTCEIVPTSTSPLPSNCSNGQLLIYTTSNTVSCQNDVTIPTCANGQTIVYNSSNVATCAAKPTQPTTYSKSANDSSLCINTDIYKETCSSDNLSTSKKFFCKLIKAENINNCNKPGAPILTTSGSSISWNAVSTGSDTKIDRYQILYKKPTQSEYSSKYISGNALSFNLSKVAREGVRETFNVRVRSENRAGISSYSSQKTVSAIGEEPLKITLTQKKNLTNCYWQNRNGHHYSADCNKIIAKDNKNNTRMTYWLTAIDFQGSTFPRPSCGLTIPERTKIYKEGEEISFYHQKSTISFSKIRQSGSGGSQWFGVRDDVGKYVCFASISEDGDIVIKKSDIIKHRPNVDYGLGGERGI